MAFGFVKTREDLIEPCATGGLYTVQRNQLIVLDKGVTIMHFSPMQIQISLLAHIMN